MRLLGYSLLRIALIAVCLVLLYLAGMRGILWAVAAILVAAALSYVLFARQRDSAAGQLASWHARRRGKRAAADDAAEDDAIEAVTGTDSDGASSAQAEG